MPDLKHNPVTRRVELKRTHCNWTAHLDRVCLGDRVDRQGHITCPRGHCFRYAAERLWKEEHPGTELDLP